jgi:hypothetical protein
MVSPKGDFPKALEKLTKNGKKMGRPKGSGGPQAVTKRNVIAAQKMFQQYAEEAMLTMVDIMRDEENDAAVRLKAANDIQNRAYGTPVNTQVQHKIIQDETGSAISTTAISSAATSDLEMLAKTLARYVEAEKATIDVTPEMPEDYPED